MIKLLYKPEARAAVDRGVAESTRKLTGVWPGDEGQHAGKA